MGTPRAPRDPPGLPAPFAVRSRRRRTVRLRRRGGRDCATVWHRRSASRTALHRSCGGPAQRRSQRRPLHRHHRADDGGAPCTNPLRAVTSWRSAADAGRLSPAHAAAAWSSSRPISTSLSRWTRWRHTLASAPCIWPARSRPLSDNRPIRYVARPPHRACERAAAKHAKCPSSTLRCRWDFRHRATSRTGCSANRNNPRRLSPERMRRSSIEERAP